MLCLQSEHATFLIPTALCFAFISSNNLYINWGNVRQRLLVIPIDALESKSETLKGIENLFKEKGHLTIMGGV